MEEFQLSTYQFWSQTAKPQSQDGAYLIWVAHTANHHLSFIITVKVHGDWQELVNNKLKNTVLQNESKENKVWTIIEVSLVFG